jgi:dUTPase
LANSIGLIDNGYRGTVRLRFKYIAQPIDYSIVDGVDYGGFVISPNLNKIYQQGDRIGQLVFAKTLSPEFSVKDSLSLTVRKEGGFGSSGS